MRFTRTLAFRLFLLIASIQTAILFALTIATLRIQQTQLMKNGEESAARVSDVIARSTRYSMLLNRKEDVQNILSSVGGEPGFEGLRIYNKDGRIIFATQPSDIHEKVDMNAEACVTCHSSNSLGTHPDNNSRMTRIFTKRNGERVLGLITAIRNEPQCSNADCHAHPPSKTILGVLDVKINLSTMDAQLAESKNRLLIFSGSAVLLVSLISGGFIWMFVRRPVKKLMHGMEMVSSGDLDHRLTENSSDELGQLARTYNRMTDDLGKARAELTAWSVTLERKVKEKTADLERAHRQIVTVEKMASLGGLAATVAHELNNPLEGILTFARLLIKRVRKSGIPPAASDQMCEELKLIADESLRCGNI
ncbi:MAG: HAMP domain-containing protein, partial [bacterium]